LQRIKELLESLPAFERDKPILCIRGKVLKPEDIMREISSETDLGKEIAEKITHVQQGSSVADIMSEEDLRTLCVERYKFHLQVPDHEKVRINILRTGSFTIKEVIQILEQRREPYKHFIEGMVGYLNWLFRR